MAKQKIRVLSYNIRKGFTPANTEFILSRIRALIKDVSADLVFLQEVLGQHHGHQRRIEDWPVEPQFEYLADTVWPHVAYGKNAIYLEGHHGNAVLSKHPFKEWENIDISNNRYERRGMLHGVIQFPRSKKELHAFCVHLDLLESGRRSQLKRLAERIESHVPSDAPLIIAGDFNDWGKKATDFLCQFLHVEEVFENLHGHSAKTFPSWFPLLALDRIYCRGLTIRMAECLKSRPGDKLSDHLPLFSEVEL